MGRAVLLDHPALRVVVRIVVAIAVAEPGALIVGIAQMSGTSPSGPRSLLALSSAWYARFDFGAVARWTTACARLSWPREARRTRRRRRPLGDEQARGIGHPDVLRRRDHQAAGDEAGVLAGLEHARHPVERGVGVAAPDALDEGADHVVVLVAPVAMRLRAQRRSRHRRA